MSTHQYAVGDRVIIDPEVARPAEVGVIWTVTRQLQVNVVITRVDGRDVETPLQFQRALQKADDDTVGLTVVRKRKTVEVRMGW